MCSYYLRAWHMLWFSDYMTDGVNVRDLGEEICGFALAGPKSKTVIDKLVEDGVDLPFMGCARMNVAYCKLTSPR